MSETTGIQWCDSTISPWFGCTKVSPGCANCYAEKDAKRYDRAGWGKGEPRVRAKTFEKNAMALNRKAEREGRRLKVFPSLCDPFDEEVTDEWKADLFSTVFATQHLDWLLLTKRTQEAARCFRDFQLDALKNLWLGTSVENQPFADERILELLQIPAWVRFLSVEPLLGPVDLQQIPNAPGFGEGQDFINALDGFVWTCSDPEYYDTCSIASKIDWVIVGGESNGRPCNVEWIRSIVEQCKAAGVPCFVKQLGSYPILDPRYNRTLPGFRRLNHPKGGDPSEWPEDLRVREMPEVKP